MNESQKQVIFLSNCMYQLESQKEKFTTNQPISSLPELGIYALFENKRNGSVDWNESYYSIGNDLRNLGLSENWIIKLKNQLNRFLQSGNSVENFRIIYLSSIEIMFNMVLQVLQSANPEIPKSAMAESIIGDIFNQNYWEGPIVEQINQVRKLSTELGFDLDFVQELGKNIASKS